MSVSKRARKAPNVEVEELLTTTDEDQDAHCSQTAMMEDRLVEEKLICNSKDLNLLADVSALPLLQRSPAVSSSRLRALNARMSTRRVTLTHPSKTPCVTRHTRSRVCTCGSLKKKQELCPYCIRTSSFQLHSSEVHFTDQPDPITRYSRVLRTFFDPFDYDTSRTGASNTDTLTFSDVLLTIIYDKSIRAENGRREFAVYATEVLEESSLPIRLIEVDHAQVSLRLMQHGIWFGCHRIWDLEVTHSYLLPIVYVVDMINSFPSNLLDDEPSTEECGKEESMFSDTVNVAEDFFALHGGGADDTVNDYFGNFQEKELH